MMFFTWLFGCVLIACVRASELDTWTKTTSGCQCYFDKKSFDCACCEDGGCQCPLDNKHQCVRCGHGKDCGSSSQVYSWTKTTSGCPCYFDKSSYDCACCESGGCQCASDNRHQCVRCGYGKDCGAPNKKDTWTKTTSGCQCYFDSTSLDCACCEKGGCQCASDNRHQCVRCTHGEDCGRTLEVHSWTRTTTGCQCYFDKSNEDCACCEKGGCQCGSNSRHQCVRCGYGEDCGKAKNVYSWTKTTSGCQCYFDESSSDCACCESGGCQCASNNRNQCVKCGYGEDCGLPNKLDPWTRTTSGCQCYFDKSSFDCACCKNGGCQCPSTNRHQCVRCTHGEDCGRSLKVYSYTRNTCGCQCYFNSNSLDCACCDEGGCQCTVDNRHQCVRCGHGEDCGRANKLDVWTKTTSGCRCYFDTASFDCACCEEGGCQCASNNRHQCVKCGRGDDCGN